MIELVLFDFDMTLVDSSYAIAHCTNLLAEHFGLRKLSREETLTIIGIHIEKAWTNVWGEFKQEWLDYYRENFCMKEDSLIRVFDSTIPTLEQLRSMGVKVGVASNRHYAQRPVKALGLEKYLDSIAGIKDVEQPKPAPDMILLSLSRLQIAKENAVYAGDTDPDMKTAKAAGIRAIGMTTGNFTREQLIEAGADFVCGSLSEIPGIVADDRTGRTE